MEYVENISCTDDGQVICITTKYGILLFETTRIAFELKIDSLPNQFTNKISNCKLLNNTRILGFIYHENAKEEGKEKKGIEQRKRTSSKIQVENDQTLVMVDIEYNKILGRIKIKGRIDDYELTKNFIIIKKRALNKVFLFKTINLEYFATIENVNLGKIRYNEYIQIEGLNTIKNNNIKNNESINTSSIKDNDSDNNLNNINIINDKQNEKKSEKNHFCILAYQDFKNKREVILFEYMLDNSRKKILNQRKRAFIPNFNSVGVKFIYLIENYLLISSNIGNKVHI